MGHAIEIKKTILKEVYKKREPWAHKYDFGHLLVIGGSKLYSGSPVLSSMAALRAGVDLVTIIAPERAANIAASFSPDLVTYPLKGDYLNERHLKDLIKFTKGKTAVVIGGGLWRIRPVLDTVAEYMKRTELPTVVDADAIHAIAKSKKISLNNCVVTPHSVEFFTLSRIEPTNKLNERIEVVKKVSKELETVVLLKGNIDIISDGEKVAINRTGNPYMTVGGTGDTLAGICGSLLAQGIDCFTAACTAAYINGRAGDIAARQLRQSMMATDLIEAIPKVIKG
jgi:hydroxyethylthiazole kinase-like uncharacterized protein yjeF